MTTKLESYAALTQTYIVHWDGSSACGKEIAAVLREILPLRGVQLDALHHRAALRGGNELIIRAHNTRTGAYLRCDLVGPRYLGVIMDATRVIALADLGEDIQVPVDVHVLPGLDGLES